MKFRGVMVEHAYMREFNNIITTLSRLAKECIVRLTDTTLYLIVSEENSTSAPPVLWCEIPQDTFFSQYHMEGLDDEHREIYLGISTVILARCLTNLKSAKSIKIKLTKKQVPCLSLDIEIPLNCNVSSVVVGADTHHVTHDIGVSVIPRRLWPDFDEPRVPPVHISLELPSLKTVRTTVELTRRLCPEVIVSGASDRLTLRAHTDVAKVATSFRDLRLHAKGPAREVDSSDEESDPDCCSCRIDAKRLSMLLAVEQISGLRRTLCSIVHGKLVILNLETELGIKLKCFIPGIAT